MALTLREIVLFPLRQVVPKRESADAQAASASPQAVSTISQGASATLPRPPRQVGRQMVITIPGGLQETTHWKTQILNGLSIYLVNL